MTAKYLTTLITDVNNNVTPLLKDPRAKWLIVSCDSKE